METNRLKQFRVVCETMNLRKAAEVMHLSHSALSKSLKVLQSELKIQLFAQNGRNIELTDEGKEFLPKVSAFLNAEEELLRREQRKAQLRIATFEVFSTYLLGQHFPTYFPNENLELRELLPGALESAILQGQVEYGITYEPIPTHGIEMVRLGKVEMRIYTSQNLQRLRFERLEFAAPVSPISGTPTGVKGLDGWPDHKVERNVKFRVDMMETALALARNGHAAVFLPEFVARHHNECVASKFRLHEYATPVGVGNVQRKVFLLRRRSRVESRLFRKLATLLRNECRMG